MYQNKDSHHAIQFDFLLLVRNPGHIAAKIASHTLRLLLLRHFGINVLTFQSQPI